MKNNKGITLIALVITIIVLAMLVGMTGYTSMDVIKNTKLEVFTTEMKIMQEEVNRLYQKTKTGDGTIQIDGETYNIIKNDNNAYETLGKELTEVPKDCTPFFEAAGISDTTGFRYYDTNTIEKLELEGITREFLVNIETRYVISLKGVENKDKMYYTLEELSDSTYNVDYNNPHDENNNDWFDFEYSIVPLDSSWQVTVNITKNTKYVNKYNIRYQKDGTDYWETVKQNADSDDEIIFEIKDPGIYNLKIEDATGHTETANFTVE